LKCRGGNEEGEVWAGKNFDEVRGGFKRKDRSNINRVPQGGIAGGGARGTKKGQLRVRELQAERMVGRGREAWEAWWLRKKRKEYGGARTVAYKERRRH